MLFFIHLKFNREKKLDFSVTRVRTSEMFLPTLLVLFFIAGNVEGKRGRIVGGYQAHIEDFPYVVSVQVHKFHICGGAIIKPNYVVTAAHCVKERLPYVIKAGVDNLLTKGVERKVKQITLHPQYDHATMDYDVAVLKLKTPFQYIPCKIHSVKLPEHSEDVPLMWGTVMGWGETYNKNERTDKLRAVNLEVYSQEICEEFEIFTMKDSMFCAGHFSGVKDSCHGDSGGPFIMCGTLYGLVSYGSEKCAEGYPGVYTKIPLVVNWIKEVSQF